MMIQKRSALKQPCSSICLKTKMSVVFIDDMKLKVLKQKGREKQEGKDQSHTYSGQNRKLNSFYLTKISKQKAT